MIANTLFNLVHGVRFALLRPLPAAGFVVGPGQLVPLFFAVVVAFVAVDFLLAGSGAEFTSFQIVNAAAVAFVLLLLLGFVVAAAGEPGRPLALLVAVLATAPLFVAVITAVAAKREAGLDGLPASLLWIWGLLLLLRCVRYAYRPRSARGVVAALAGAGLIAWAPGMIYVYPTLWYVPEQSVEDTFETPDVERLYYAQPATLRAHTDALAPERPGVADLYLLAYASDTSETVFATEVDYVRQLFDERFDTDGRSLILVNDSDRTEDFPLANAHNLAAALRQIGAKMNPDEDYLFLYLTSHGSEDHELSARFWPFYFKNLPAAQLRSLLDESGIRRRIVAVSACYAGGFIDALKDDYTVVMTAAAADRPSFGCSNDRDLTYFGEAYFRDSLTKEDAFVDAFGAARELLLVRETEAGYEYSDPQIHVGAAIAAELPGLTQALKNRRGDRDTAER